MTFPHETVARHPYTAALSYRTMSADPDLASSLQIYSLAGNTNEDYTTNVGNQRICYLKEK